MAAAASVENHPLLLADTTLERRQLVIAAEDGRANEYPSPERASPLLATEEALGFLRPPWRAVRWEAIRPEPTPAEEAAPR